MNIRDKILIVEDERSITNFLRTILTSNDYDVIIARSGAEAYSMITSHCPDLIVLDLGLPDIDGLQIIKSVREWTLLPIVVVSARAHERDKVEALDLGADDYITKPFGAGELLARIRTAIRHTRTGLANETIATTGKFKSGDLEIDYDKHQVLVEGKNVGLTQNEYKIVALLGKCAGGPARAATISPCAFTWQTSAARSKKARQSLSIYSPRSVWATEWSRATDNLP